MFAHGYRKQVNVDNCEVVVAQQRERYPMLTWKVLQTADVSDQVIDIVKCRTSSRVQLPSAKRSIAKGPRVKFESVAHQTQSQRSRAWHIMSSHIRHTSCASSYHRRSASPANSAVQVMDVRSMGEFADGSFDIVLDKGLLDNLYCYREVGS